MFTRRDFLQTLAAATAGIMLPSVAGAQPGGPTAPATQPIDHDKWGRLLPQRRLGRTGLAVTMLGLGGAHLGGIGERMGDAGAQETIERAIAGGVRYFDNAESYGSAGYAEKLYGKFLTPKYREQIFLMTKSYTPYPKDAKTVREHLEGSLKRLNTDYLDLWAIHSIQSPKDADMRISSGVLDFFIEAKAKGRVRHIGFTGHVTPEGNNRMLELVAQHGDLLETCQMPINVLDCNYGSFILGTLPNLVQRGYGICAMKTLAGGGFFRKAEFLKTHPNWKATIPDLVSLEDAVHFVWSLPVSVLVSGPDTPQQFQEMIGHARTFVAMTPERRKDLIAKVAEMAEDRTPQKIEWYKPKPGAPLTQPAGGPHTWLPAEPPHRPVA